jgi:signal transduction histidine kinase
VGHAALINLRVDGSDDGPGSYAKVCPGSALLRQAVECLEDAVAITAQPSENHAIQVVFGNAAFHALVNCPDSDENNTIQGDNGNDDPIWASLIASHQTDGVYTADIERQAGADGRMLLHLRSEPAYDESGQITYRVAIFHDGTKKANLEEMVCRNKHLASIGLLAAGIAHEINNPTGSALLAAETALALKDTPNSTDHVTACLQNIVTSMDRCGRIVRTLLRYSRQEPTERQACSINDVAEQSLNLTRPYAASHRADLRLDMDSSVPLAPMNPLEIELVLVNLIRNAIEAGGRDTVISVATQSGENSVRVTVRDNGRGMSKEQIARAFDPLYTTRRDQGGSGLGMSIAHSIVLAHKGQMEVESQEGKGTTVTIDLPIVSLPEAIDTKGHNSHGTNSNCGG